VNKKCGHLLATLTLLASAAWNQPVYAQSRSQHFVCDRGYTAAQCQVAMDILRVKLRKYPTHDLGDWTWVVVRSIDWKRLLYDRNLSSDVPAFTYLPERETFFDEALLDGASPRGIELALSWHRSIPELLDLAIRHELGHALCNERNEAAAKRTAQLLLIEPEADTLRVCRPKKPNI